MLFIPDNEWGGKREFTMFSISRYTTALTIKELFPTVHTIGCLDTIA